jgi:hypothetical protein
MPGRIKRVYRPKDAMTPLDKLASLPEAAKHLREGVTLEDLRQVRRTDGGQCRARADTTDSVTRRDLLSRLGAAHWRTVVPCSPRFQPCKRPHRSASK